jgi:hypothetical protein
VNETLSLPILPASEGELSSSLGRLHEQRLSFMIYGKNSENIRLKMFFSCLSNFLKSLEYLEIRD